MGVFDDWRAANPNANQKAVVNVEFVLRMLDKLSFLGSHPVGSIYLTVAPDESTVSQMAVKYGGIWTAWGQGRVPVGFNSSETEFDSIGKTGGEKTNTLTAAQSGLRSHAHPDMYHHTGNVSADHAHYVNGSGAFTSGDDSPDHTHVVRSSAGVGSSSTMVGQTGNTQNASPASLGASTRHRHTVPDHGHGWTGGISANHYHGITVSTPANAVENGSAHNNIQPYIVCYMYQRSA